MHKRLLLITPLLAALLGSVVHAEGEVESSRESHGMVLRGDIVALDALECLVDAWLTRGKAN